MVRPSVVLTLAAMLSATLVASSNPQQTTPPPPPPAKPPATRPATPATRPATPAGKPAPTTAKPGTAPAATAKPAPAPPPPPKPPTDVRLKTSYTQGAQVSQNVMYVQGPRQRVEFPGVVSLDQCDLKRSVMLNTSAKRYRMQPYAESTAAAAASPAVDPDMAQMAGMGQKPKAGVITITTTLTDTLERQPMFGLEARRVKTVVVKQTTGNACDKSAFKIEMDTWYVDLPEPSMCVRPPAAAPPPPPAGGCTDTTETRTVGDVKLGFPVRMTTTTTMGDGDKAIVSTSSQEVTELEITRLDRALFDVPSDYTEAKSAAEIVPAISQGGGLADALFGSTADGSSTAAPKKAGTIRIGILEPVNKTTRELSSNVMRQDLVSKFNKAPYEALPIAGSSAAAIEQDAARLECDYLLLTEITEAKTSKPGKLGGVMSKAGGGPAKDSHEVKLDYKLYAVGATQTPKLTGNAKGSNGGFGVGSALRLAAFAGQMYLSMMTGGMGMMNGMMGMSGMGGGMGAIYDPRVSAMSSLAMSMGAGAGMSGMSGMAGMGGDPSEAEMRETVSEALGNAAKATMEQLNKKK